MAKRKETEFDKLARLIKSESEDIRGRVDRLEQKVDEGFSVVIRRLDTIIQIQLDQHANRIKKLETAVFK